VWKTVYAVWLTGSARTATPVERDMLIIVALGRLFAGERATSREDV